MAQYPSYLAPRVGEVKPTYSPLVSAVVAYAFSFVAQLLVAIPIGFLVVAHGIAVISRPHTDDDITHAAFVAVMLRDRRSISPSMLPVVSSTYRATTCSAPWLRWASCSRWRGAARSGLEAPVVGSDA